MPDLFSASGGMSLKVETTASYDAGITGEVDRQIRHMQGVMLYCSGKAAELKRATGSSNFKIVAQVNPQTMRPRFYVAPANAKGVHEELSQAVLLKAALGMAGK